MVISVLAGCAVDTPTPDTILGLQVVAMETFPPEPAPLETLRLKAWVADGQGRGAEVVTFACTPYQGRCVEAYPPGSKGLPLDVWVRAGVAAPTFETEVAWPLFAAIAQDSFALPEEVAGTLLVWTLACTPGLCDIVDRIEADPVAGSEAWESIAHDLANPQEWMDALPRGQVSLAVKVVPVFLTSPIDATIEGDTATTNAQPNNAPFLLPLDSLDSGAALSSAPDDPVSRFRIGDPDLDVLSVRSFVTAGGVVQERPSDTGVRVLWQEPLSPLRAPVKFVVVEDGRGGTAVWSSYEEDGRGCADSGVVLGTTGDPLVAGDALPLTVGQTVSVALRAVVEADGPEVIVDWRLVSVADGLVLGSLEQVGSPLGGYDSGQCSGTLPTTTLTLPVTAGSAGPVDFACSLGGTRQRVEIAVASFRTGALLASASQEVFLTLPPGLGCSD